MTFLTVQKNRTSTARYFSMALLACVDAQVNVIVPSNLLQHNLSWIYQESDLLLTDVQNLEVQDNLPASFYLPNCQPASSLKPLDFETNIQLCLQTSGSSGEAKRVKKTWRDMLYEAKALLDTMPVNLRESSTVMIGSVTPQHLYGFSFRIMLHLLSGWQMVSERKIFPETLLGSTLQETSHPVVWICSPTLLHSLQETHLQPLSLKVDFVISSGAPLQASHKQFLQRMLHTDVLEIYGSTETGAIAKRISGNYWQFFEEVHYQCDEEKGLWVKSPWCPEQWISDHILVHQHGFDLLGRIDRVIKLADKRISLAQLEMDLLRHAFVNDIYLEKSSTSRHLTALVALSEEGIHVWCHQGRKKVVTALKQHLAHLQEAVAIPRYWRFSDALPRNTQGKLDRKTIEHMLSALPELPLWKHLSEQGDNNYEIHAKVPVDLRYFNGHFEQFPLVPGVVQLKWVLEALRIIHWFTGYPRQWENLKFQQFLRPNDDFTMQLKRDLLKQKISFALVQGDKKIASGRFVMPSHCQNGEVEDSVC